MVHRVEKWLTERQIGLIAKRRQVHVRFNGTILILKPKTKNMKLHRRIENYKKKILELKSKLK